MNARAPLVEWSCWADSTTTGAPASKRRMGRLAVERKVHFQLSSSSELRLSSGIIRTASNKVLSVMLRTLLAPAPRATSSRIAGRKEGAETRRLKLPARKPVTRKNPFASVNATWCCPALPATSTVAPICATPAESRTYPDSDEGDTPADAATHSEITTAKPASIRVIVRPPTEVSGTETLRPKPASAG